MNRKLLIRIVTVPVSFEKLLEGQLSFIGKYFEVVAVASNESELRRVAKLQNVPFFCANLTRRITPLNDLMALIRLYRFFKAKKPYIVHSHTPKAGTVGMLAARLAGVPHRLHTIAGLPLLEATGGKRKLLNAVEKWTYACATRIYPNSQKLKEIILKEGFCPERKLKVIGKGSSNGINTSHFDRVHFTKEDQQRLRYSLKIHQEDFIFIFVGRLVVDKGIRELVSAFCRFNEEHHGSKLLLVGPEERELYPLPVRLRQTIKEHNNIISVGNQNDVRPFLAISNALVFPSYREGFPNVVMQAGSMDLPAIVSDINGCNEIIEHGMNGLIVPVKDEHALYWAMKEMVTKESVYKKLRDNARNVIVSRYEQEYVWNELLDEYKRIERSDNIV